MNKEKSLFKVSMNNLIIYVVVPIFILYISSNVVIMRYAIKDKLKSNDIVIDRVADNINNNFQLASLALANMSNDNEIHNLFYKWIAEETAHSKSIADTEISRNINRQLNHNNIYEGLVFELKDGSKYVYGNGSFYEDNLEENSIKEYVDNKINLVNESITNDKVMLVLPISNQLTIIDKVWMIIDEKFFSTDLSTDEFELEGLIRRDNLSVSDGTITFEDGMPFYYNIKPLDKFGLSIVAKFQLNSLVSIILNVLLILIGGIILLIIALFIYYKKFKNLILNPIKNTAEKINEVTVTGNLNEKFERNTITELDLINMNLNNMIKEINTLIEDNKRIDEEKIEVEVKVLQSQITSHFIFNTLNSIRILAFINNDNEVGMQIQNFIALIRNNFTRGNMHTVKEEVYSIQSYCDLMKLRYGEKFSVVINVDEELNSKKILKLILQPIIENSITHGFSMKNFEGEILINISKVNNKMVIEILDNGVGISEEDMKKIMTGSTTGIAIYNSNRRIKLYYGDDYGINIESEVNKYTKSIIVLPIID